jgi:hypothetical protein
VTVLTTWEMRTYSASWEGVDDDSLNDEEDGDEVADDTPSTQIVDPIGEEAIQSLSSS